MKDWFLLLYGVGGVYYELSKMSWGIPRIPELSLPSFFTVTDTINGFVITGILYFVYYYYKSQGFRTEDI